MLRTVRTCIYSPDNEMQNPQDVFGDLEKKIGHIPVFFKELAASDPMMQDAILKLDSHIWEDGVLTRAEKKLIAIALAAGLRDGHALHAQMKGAKNLGISKEEIDEALRVAFLLAGMPAYVAGKTAAEKIYS